MPMNKQEFLNQLRSGLNGLPHEEIEERVMFYSEMIDDRVEEGLSEEDAGRQERYAFFREVMAETKGNKIATAHNKDDNAETILMHIVRSSGIKGICGIPPKREEIIRPLL